MKKLRMPIILSVIIGCFFGYYFQIMAYWSPKTLLWLWVGVALSYLFSLLALILIIARIFSGHVKHETITDGPILLIGAIVAIMNILSTTFLLIAGLSGM
ncbi:hypothetical protein [Sporolactobacillus laevolacticus]|uniref:hypothetical protein n=1 Tax=Sporolactobacillus laevolacticus TaxID=33018 RepID=UPI0025B30584|nr:hypothetical protein [Sporolactobacillus laevolacticus]MDN3953789.1 hypothetical protein [Sporolactobacillus laevolacticus]